MDDELYRPIIINNITFFIIYSKTNDYKLLYSPTKDISIRLSNEELYKILHRDEFLTKRVYNIFSSKPSIDLDMNKRNCEKEIPVLCISLSESCRLNCAYCTLDRIDNCDGPVLMHQEYKKIITSYITYLKENNYDLGKTIRIYFTEAGEPSYNYYIFYKAVEFIKLLREKTDLHISLSIATNGYYNSDIMQYIIDSFDMVELALDGPEVLHNIHRQTVNRKWTHDTVESNAFLLHKSSTKHRFNVVLSKYSISHYTNILDYFHEKFEYSMLYIMPMTFISKTRESRIPAPTQDEFRSTALSIRDYISSNRLHLDVSFFNSHCISSCNSMCSGMCGDLFAVDCKGHIHCCFCKNSNYHFNIGLIDFETDRFNIDNNMLSHIRGSLNVDNLEKCKNCFARYKCKGGCSMSKLSGYPVDCSFVQSEAARLLQNTALEVLSTDLSALDNIS